MKCVCACSVAVDHPAEQHVTFAVDIPLLKEKKHNDTEINVLSEFWHFCVSFAVDLQILHLELYQCGNITHTLQKYFRLAVSGTASLAYTSPTRGPNLVPVGMYPVLHTPCTCNMQSTLYTCRSLQKAWYTSLLTATATIRNIALHVTFKCES
jgi:hypothetical protein